MIFLDSNVLIDPIEVSSRFSSWSLAAVARERRDRSLVANMVVFAECAGHFSNVEDQLAYFGDLQVGLANLSPDAARHAGRAHRAYRAAGGPRLGVLADFLIGGHALALGATLLTRDRQRFTSYFSELPLITPETHP